MPSHSRYLQPDLQKVTCREHLATILGGWTQSMNSFQPLTTTNTSGPRRSTQGLTELRKRSARADCQTPHTESPWERNPSGLASASWQLV